MLDASEPVACAHPFQLRMLAVQRREHLGARAAEGRQLAGQLLDAGPQPRGRHDVVDAVAAVGQVVGLREYLAQSRHQIVGVTDAVHVHSEQIAVPKPVALPLRDFLDVAGCLYCCHDLDSIPYQ
ncbi:hypothetical protein ACTD5D_31800 [Nocardia takedensis]|uniref:hypothetical protein n=1 Tax=Nocardia takedensis TaxID=259390 RepID=UPI003F75BB61